MTDFDTFKPLNIAVLTVSEQGHCQRWQIPNQSGLKQLDCRLKRRRNT